MEYTYTSVLAWLPKLESATQHLPTYVANIKVERK